MAKEPDEARPGPKDDSGLSQKPGELPLQVQPAETSVAQTPVENSTTTPDPHATGEGPVLVDTAAHEEPQNHPYDETYHDEHSHNEYHHDDYHHDEHHGQGHDHAVAERDEYGGGTPVYAGGSSYGGGPPRDESGAEAEEEEGGPVKSFLDHLEDLRWTLIKCAVATGVAMLVCLIAGDFIMQKILLRPLEKAELLSLSTDRKLVTLMVGTNIWGKFRVPYNQFSPLDLGTNKIASVQVVSVPVGTNLILALTPSTNPPPPMYQRLLNLGPVGGFYVAFQIAMYGGIVVAAPLLIFYIAQFVLPALKVKEKKYVLRGFAVGTFLFFLGVSFCYFILLPFALNASARYSEWLGFAADQWTAELYLSFVCKFMLGMGLGFEMPVVILTLVKIGIVNYQQLASFRRYMIVINLILGAVLTTPEVLTQVMMAIPLQILYEISVWIAWYWERRDKKKAALAGET